MIFWKGAKNKDKKWMNVCYTEWKMSLSTESVTMLNEPESAPIKYHIVKAPLSKTSDC